MRLFAQVIFRELSRRRIHFAEATSKLEVITRSLCPRKKKKNKPSRRPRRARFSNLFSLFSLQRNVLFSVLGAHTHRSSTLGLARVTYTLSGKQSSCTNTRYTHIQSIFFLCAFDLPRPPRRSVDVDMKKEQEIMPNL